MKKFKLKNALFLLTFNVVSVASAQVVAHTTPITASNTTAPQPAPATESSKQAIQQRMNFYKQHIQKEKQQSKPQKQTTASATTAAPPVMSNKMSSLPVPPASSLNTLLNTSPIGNENNNSSNYQVISGHGYQYATISLANISRLVCNQDITTLIYSRMAHMEVTKADNHNLFIQLLPVKEIKPDGKTKLLVDSNPRELFVKCGNRMYSLILVPQDIPTATIILESPAPEENIHTVRELLGGKSYTDQLSQLIAYAYKEVPPPGFRVNNVFKPYKKFQQLSMYTVRVYKGGPYEITEYLINAKQNINLYEGLFIPYLKHPLAISIVNPKLLKGQSTRMIVVSERTHYNR